MNKTDDAVTAEDYQDESGKDMDHRDSVFEIDASNVGFWYRMKVLFSNTCFLYLLAAGFFRFFGGYSLGFLWAGFFEERYPQYTDQYALMTPVVITGAGLPASLLGGYLSDRLEDRFGSIKGLIAGCGALAAIPFIIVAYALQLGFWVSIMAYYCAYFLGEMWYGPSHAQINNMFPSEYQGIAVAVFNLLGAIAGTIATLLLGWLQTRLDDDSKTDL